MNSNRRTLLKGTLAAGAVGVAASAGLRSEERLVGKEGRDRGARDC